MNFIDFRGHGLSTGTRGHIDKFDSYCEDVLIFINKKIKQGKKIILCGVGMGALVAIKLHQTFFNKTHRDIEGIILLNPALKIKIEVNQFPHIISKSLGKYFKKVKIPFLFDGHDINDDREIAEVFNSDPLINKSITLNLYSELCSNGKKVRTSSYFLDVPTLTLYSSNNFLYDNQTMILFEKGIGRKLSKIIEYKDCPHDLLNDFNREKVVNDLYNWINNLYLEIV